VDGSFKPNVVGAEGEPRPNNLPVGLRTQIKPARIRFTANKAPACVWQLVHAAFYGKPARAGMKNSRFAAPTAGLPPHQQIGTIGLRSGVRLIQPRTLRRSEGKAKRVID
jgi:hypothetical protein